MRVSIIIPVHNCDKYIEECLDSVCQQTLTDIEIICIDDGSSDHSFELIHEYKKRDNRVQLFTQEKQGAGIARNYGLSVSKGDYVIFLDADDYYLDKDALQIMYRCCLNNKVYACGSVMTLLKDNRLLEDAAFKRIREIAGDSSIFCYSDYQFDYGYTGFLFKRELLINMCVEFPPYKRFQDPPFFVKAMYYAEKFSFAQCKLYCYRVPVMSTRYNQEKVIDLLLGIRDNLLFAKEHNLWKLFSTTLMRLEYEYFSIICRNINPNNDEAMRLLAELDKLSAYGKEDKSDKIRTLQFLENDSKEMFEHYEENLVKEINQQDSIYVYGAGGLSQKLLKFFENENVLQKVMRIIVSEKGRDDISLNGIDVIELCESNVRKDIPIYIAVGAIYQYEIIQNLKCFGCGDYTIVDSVFLETL